jgi:hypothetical protein
MCSLRVMHMPIYMGAVVHEDMLNNLINCGFLEALLISLKKNRS